MNPGTSPCTSGTAGTVYLPADTAGRARAAFTMDFDDYDTVDQWMAGVIRETVEEIEDLYTNGQEVRQPADWLDSADLNGYPLYLGRLLGRARFAFLMIGGPSFIDWLTALIDAASDQALLIEKQS